MKPILPLFIFIDAFGWEFVRNDSFALSIAPFRRKLESVFGYSSTCVPSILSGRWPVEHRNWSYFVYNPEHSPFQPLRPLRYLPKFISSRRRFRHRLSKLTKKSFGFAGYFDLYNVPFEHIHLFDFSEKKSPLLPGGMNVGPNIFDFLEKRHLPYYVSDPNASETANLSKLVEAVGSEAIDFAFLYWPGLDGLLHVVGTDAPEIEPKLRLYESWIESLLAVTAKHYEDIHLYIFSDHGMANCDVHWDLKALIDALPFRMPEDYAVFYDSTMARFWFFNDAAREGIVEKLETLPQGRILSDRELEEMHVLFPDRYFGELIYLVEEGTLIVPSDMGERPIRAMHGYHPKARQSYAALLSNRENIPEDITAIPHIYKLMTAEAELAQQTNVFARKPSPASNGGMRPVSS